MNSSHAKKGLIGNYRSFEINDDGACFVIFAESIKKS